MRALVCAVHRCWRALGGTHGLARDVRGNTLAIVAAALIPLTAMIGSGVDMSRAYMAKQRLQQACDAGALAGRRAMTDNQLTSGVVTEAKKFFNFNFPQGTYQTATFVPTVTKPEDGKVKMTAETNIPTTVMSLFGFTTLPLKVNCDASQNFINTDIVLVLDTTGSMANDANGNAAYSGPTSKIVALRAAVLALYDELKPVQDQLVANGMRLRYGIVPYSSSVNVGKLVRAVNTSYIADVWTYQSRTYTSMDAPPGLVDQNTCLNADTLPAAYLAPYGLTHVEGGQWNTPASGWCRVITGYNYTTRSVDTSSYAAGNTVNVFPIIGGTKSTAKNTTWDGCIEERQTDSSITSTSGYAISSTAKDLQIDLIPSSDAGSKWAPMWPEVVFYKNTDPYWPTQSVRDSGNYACPVQASRLAIMTRGNLNSYLNSLVAAGSTYHDIGMIWGARFISSDGVFGSDNPESYNGMPVNRHIIFMTDGKLEPTPYAYSSYGLEYYQRKVGSTINYYTDTGDQTLRHRQRFKMACNAAKGLNVSIWSIYFGGTDVGAADKSALTECASNAAQFASVSDKDALIDKFVEIGKNIGALRLTR